MEFKSKMRPDGQLEFLGGSAEVANPGRKRKAKFESVGTLKAHLESEIARTQKALEELVGQYSTITRAFDPETFSEVMKRFVDGEKLDVETDTAVDLKLYLDKNGDAHFRSANITIPFVTTLAGEEHSSLDSLDQALRQHKKVRAADKLQELFAVSLSNEELGEIWEERTRPTSGARVMHKADLKAMEKADPARAAKLKDLRQQAADGKAPVHRAERKWHADDSDKIRAKAYQVAENGEAPQTQVFEQPKAVESKNYLDAVADMLAVMAAKGAPAADSVAKKALEVAVRATESMTEVAVHG